MEVHDKIWAKLSTSVINPNQSQSHDSGITIQILKIYTVQEEFRQFEHYFNVVEGYWDNEK